VQQQRRAQPSDSQGSRHVTQGQMCSRCMAVLRDGKCQRCDELDNQSHQQRRGDRDRKPQEITGIQKQQYAASSQSHQVRQVTNTAQKQTQGRQEQQYQPRQPQPKAADPEDDKYERQGDYYQCIKCEEYTVHVNDDKHCENQNCPSNNNKPKAPSR
jgi:hypothetical protein